MKPEPYEPSPEEIQAGCESIREEWSEAEHQRRASKKTEGWQTPEVKTPDFCEERFSKEF